MGVTPEEAFYVKCDRMTMTQDDIDNGKLICETGVAPVKPARYVVFGIRRSFIMTVVAVSHAAQQCSKIIPRRVDQLFMVA